MSFNDVLKEINDTRLSQETRNIFKLLVELIKTVTNDRDSKILEMQKKLEENFEQSVNIIAAKDNQINELTTKLQTATESNKSLKAEVTQMKNLHDDLEAYGRSDSLIFSGPKVSTYTEGENCSTIARNLIRDTLKLQIDPLISTAHRIGSPPAESSSPDKRGILVKFVRRDDKFKILQQARGKDTKVNELYVNESLTPTRAKIKNVLLQCKKMKDSPITGVSTQNCKVYVYTKPSADAPSTASSIKQEIGTKEKLAEFCRNFINSSLDTFKDSRGNKIFQ